MKYMSINEFRLKCDSVIERVKIGKEVVVTKDDLPKVVMVPVGETENVEELFSVIRAARASLAANSIKNIEYRKCTPKQIDVKIDKHWDQARVMLVLKEEIKKRGSFPTTRQLNNGSINKYIRETGGANKYREMFGFKGKYRNESYWKPKTIAEELMEMSKQLGHFPSISEVFKRSSRLYYLLRKDNGLEVYRKKLGYK